MVVCPSGEFYLLDDNVMASYMTVLRNALEPLPCTKEGGFTAAYRAEIKWTLPGEVVGP